jgi:hypothetical protein
MPDNYEKAYEKAIERIRKAREQFFLETSVTLELISMAQARLMYTMTDTMTRGYFGILNGTTGAIMDSYAGFLDGFSRAWDRMPDKTTQQKSSRRPRGKRKKA